MTKYLPINIINYIIILYVIQTLQINCTIMSKITLRLLFCRLKLQQLRMILLSSIMLVLTTLLCSCATQPPAPVEYNHNKEYSESSDINVETQQLQQPEEGIVSKKLEQKQEEFEHSTGILNDPKDRVTEELILPEKKPRSAPLYYKPEPPMPDETLKKDNIVKFIKPIDGKIISKFGEETAFGRNKGLNIVADYDTPVKAVASGVVIYSGKNQNFGNLIIIKLDGTDLYVAFAHIKELILSKNDIVKQGQIIGNVGTSGNIKEPQLYIAMKKGTEAVDPLDYIDFTIGAL